ncbi:hypothetical protein BOO86_22905 [Mycobacterium sp. CBMA 234]|nr:hypothetical protein [Mycolicibacterium sp. CBMA 234]
MISDLLGITVTPEGIVRKPDTKLSVEPIRCLEAIQAGLNTISLIGRTGFAAQILHGDQHAQVVQMIASFPADADASAFREIVTQKWRRCQNQQATITDGQTSLTYTVDAVDQVNSVAAVSMSVTAGDGTQVTCQHALGARRNVAIDVRVCAPNVANKGRELVAKIAAGL